MKTVIYRVMDESMIGLGLAREINQDRVDQINQLLPQLSSLARTLDIESVKIVAQNSRLYLAEDEETGQIVGMATLVVVSKLMRTEGYVEDVVVDKDSRRQGVGDALMEYLIHEGRRLCLKRLCLTSRESREEANRLYRRNGFVPRETNVYQFKY